MKIAFLYLLSILVPFNLLAQINKVDSQNLEVLTNSIYRKQFEELVVLKNQYLQLRSSRGIPTHESDRYIDLVSNRIKSYDDINIMLGKFFGLKSQTGILLYFFDHDTLQRTFFSEGKIIEQKKFFIHKEDLLKLSSNINIALNVAALSINRSPKVRGAKVEAKSQTKTKNLDTCIEIATKILLPEVFNEYFKHLIIIPSLNIGSIPFHILKPYKDGSYLIDKCSFTIAPSLIDLLLVKLKSSMRINGLKGLNEQLSNNGENIQVNFTIENPLFVANPNYPTNTHWDFPFLPGAKEEIKNAISFTKKYCLLQGDSATKENVIKNLRNCDIAYFATHGVASDIDPMNGSFIVLSGNNSPFLTANDIMQLRDSTLSGKINFPEMVILSACQTGLGKSTEAGVAGLARSFFISGSNAVVMSLWNVDDNATAYLMNRFLFYLQQPSNYMPSEPLRQAILDTKSKYPDPVQWASFSLFGVDF